MWTWWCKQRVFSSKLPLSAARKEFRVFQPTKRLSPSSLLSHPSIGALLPPPSAQIFLSDSHHPLTKNRSSRAVAWDLNARHLHGNPSVKPGDTGRGSLLRCFPVCAHYSSSVHCIGDECNLSGVNDGSAEPICPCVEVETVRLLWHLTTGRVSLVMNTFDQH